MKELYSEIILELSKDKTNFGIIEHNKSEEGFNHLCGDNFKIYLMLSNNKLENISFIGNGCAISTASTALMVSITKNKDVSEIKTVIEDFLNMVTNKSDLIPKKLKIFENMKNYPSRIKCATLSWHALKNGLE